MCGAEAESRNTGPRRDATTNPNEGEGDGDDDDDDDDDDENKLRTEAERSAMKATVLKVVINLTNEGLLGARDARAVNDMIKDQHPVLVAAFKVSTEENALLLSPGVIAVVYAYVLWVFRRGLCDISQKSRWLDEGLRACLELVYDLFDRQKFFFL